MAPPLGNHHAQKWAPEHDASLRKLKMDGYSGSQAAAALNDEFKTIYSRNAVIGRLHRLGLTDRTTRFIPRIVKPRRYEQPHPSWAKRKPALSMAQIIELRCTEVVPRGISLIDLEPNECRYPYGDGPFVFCGHPALECSSYCAVHHALCWDKPKPSKERYLVQRAAA